MSAAVDLRKLFEVEMQYQADQSAITTARGKVGKYVGSGNGTVTGLLNGEIRWDLYEDIDNDVCLTNLAGEIATSDGAVIHFDARGHGKVTDPSKPHRWTMVYGVKFNTENPNYDWLNATLGVWEGEFNMNTYKHHYQIHARLEE